MTTSDRPPPLDPARDELTDADVDFLLERFDLTEPALQRKIVVAFMVKASRAAADLTAARDLADEMAMALEKHMGIQNGPPVGADYRTWREAMDASVAALSSYR